MLACLMKSPLSLGEKRSSISPKQQVLFKLFIDDFVKIFFIYYSLP